MTQVDWHPYPEEKPRSYKRYLTTILAVFNEITINIAYWDKDHWLTTPSEPVLAWAELPEPYQPPEESNHPDDITAKKYVENDPETLRALGIFDK